MSDAYLYPNWYNATDYEHEAAIEADWYARQVARDEADELQAMLDDEELCRCGEWKHPDVTMCASCLADAAAYRLEDR